jgi:hypothetical protein
MNFVNKPPYDIASNSFFAEIDWNAVYNRAVPGPWLPEPEKKSSKNDMSNRTAGNENDRTNAKASTPASDKNSDVVSNFSHRNYVEDGQSEFLTMRESIIQSPSNDPKNNENGIVDWSFFDENLLMQANKLGPTKS